MNMSTIFSKLYTTINVNHKRLYSISKQKNCKHNSLNISCWIGSCTSCRSLLDYWQSIPCNFCVNQKYGTSKFQTSTRTYQEHIILRLLTSFFQLHAAEEEILNKTFSVGKPRSKTPDNNSTTGV
jgi:hypothetical protein